MVPSISSRTLILVALIGVTAALLALIGPMPSSALPDYTAKIGQPCATCHLDLAGGGPLTLKGQAFASIPTHTTDPVGAWNQVSGVPAPTPTPPAPAPGGPVSVALSGAATDDSVVYSIVVRNSGNQDISTLFVAGSIPSGASFSAAIGTPAGSSFSGADGGAASWLVGSVPAQGAVGPFVYRVARGTAQDLSASAFVHWTAPSEGTAASASVAPISNDQRLAVEQAINDKFNNLDRSLTLWNIQPGLGTVMIEYNIRFANLWFAAQANNWDMARYQIAEMTEIQEVGETTRPARAPLLKAFEDAFLSPLDDAAVAKNSSAFAAAYDRAIAGCNSCHAGSTGVPPNRAIPAKFIKITRPSASVFPNVDWRGQ